MAEEAAVEEVEVRQYAYIGECEAGFITCFGHKWESGRPYKIRVDAMVPGSIRKKRDGTSTPGYLVVDKLDGNKHFTCDLDKIAFLAAARKERQERARIMADKELSFELKDTSKVESILAEPVEDVPLGETVEDETIWDNGQHAGESMALSDMNLDDVLSGAHGSGE